MTLQFFADASGYKLANNDLLNKINFGQGLENAQPAAYGLPENNCCTPCGFADCEAEKYYQYQLSATPGLKHIKNPFMMIMGRKTVVVPVGGPNTPWHQPAVSQVGQDLDYGGTDQSWYYMPSYSSSWYYTRKIEDPVLWIAFQIANPTRLQNQAFAHGVGTNNLPTRNARFLSDVPVADNVGWSVTYPDGTTTSCPVNGDNAPVPYTDPDGARRTLYKITRIGDLGMSEYDIVASTDAQDSNYFGSTGYIQYPIGSPTPEIDTPIQELEDSEVPDGGFLEIDYWTEKREVPIYIWQYPDGVPNAKHWGFSNPHPTRYAEYMEDPHNPPVMIGIKFGDIPIDMRPNDEGTYLLEVIVEYKGEKPIEQRSICYQPLDTGEPPIETLLCEPVTLATTTKEKFCIPFEFKWVEEDFVKSAFGPPDPNPGYSPTGHDIYMRHVDVAFGTKMALLDPPVGFWFGNNFAPMGLTTGGLWPEDFNLYARNTHPAGTDHNPSATNNDLDLINISRYVEKCKVAASIAPALTLFQRESGWRVDYANDEDRYKFGYFAVKSLTASPLYTPSETPAYGSGSKGPRGWNGPFFFGFGWRQPYLYHHTMQFRTAADLPLVKCEGLGYVTPEDAAACLAIDHFRNPPWPDQGPAPTSVPRFRIGEWSTYDYISWLGSDLYETGTMPTVYGTTVAENSKYAYSDLAMKYAVDTFFSMPFQCWSINTGAVGQEHNCYMSWCEAPLAYGLLGSGTKPRVQLKRPDYVFAYRNVGIPSHGGGAYSATKRVPLPGLVTPESSQSESSGSINSESSVSSYSDRSGPGTNSRSSQSWSSKSSISSNSSGSSRDVTEDYTNPHLPRAHLISSAYIRGVSETYTAHKIQPVHATYFRGGITTSSTAPSSRYQPWNMYFAQNYQTEATQRAKIGVLYTAQYYGIGFSPYMPFY